MKRWSVLLAAGLITIANTLMIGCGDNRSADSQESGNLDLISAFGGYDDANESPAFGDAAMAQYMAEDEVFSDPSLGSSQIDSLAEMPGARVFRLAVRWGMLGGDSSHTVITDWSGSVQLTRGAVAVRRLIRFEPGQDHIVRPRESRSRLDWVSKTSVSYDGLLLIIVDPPVPPDSNWPTNTLTFTTAPYSRVFTLDELSALEEIVTAGELGNQISFNARELNLEPCGGGPLEGAWVTNPATKRGHFFGKWMSGDGAVTGHMRGHFGVRSSGERVFFGKYVDPDGHFRGLLRGTWGKAPDDSTLGWFAGIWAERSGLPVGILRGRWHVSPGAVDDSMQVGDGQGRGREDGNFGFGGVHWGGGFFSGSWERSCVRRDTLAVPRP